MRIKYTIFMAKARSIIKLSGTIGDITFVDSKAYGFHSRKKRTKWEKSAGMIASSTNQSVANLMAKIIFDAANEFAPGFKDGKFWSRLVSVFRQQAKAAMPFSYAGFHQMEMRPDYPSSKHGRFMIADGSRNQTPETSIAKLSLNYQVYNDVDLQLSLLRIVSDETLLIPITREASTMIIPAGEKMGSLDLDFAPLAEGFQALYVLKCEQMEDGKVTGLLKGMSVCFLKAL